MAKGKGKGGSSGGPRKSHGPKRKLFKEFKPMIKAFADAGLLDKYHNYESFCLACNTRGKKNPTRREFTEFTYLTREKQNEYFKSISK
jgi:hypothetical protein